jgi:Carboxypeptidase regulatory-like domain
VTDAAGLYDAPNLTPGNYTVRVEAPGFRTLERRDVVLGVGTEVRVDLTPQPGEQQQTITVTEAAPLLEATNATLGGSVSNKDINDLPLNGRNYQNLVALRPGVMIQPGGGPWTQSTNNIRPDEVAWNVEGVLNANFFDARPVASQEFRTEENPKAEWGWKPGAVVNVGIKSGTNSVHGSAYAFGRSDAMAARNYFNPGLIGGSCLSNTNLPAVCDKLPAS